MTTKHFYAAKHYYGIEFCNDYSTLFRFESAKERDEFVDDSNYEESSNGSIKTEAVTRNEARRHFPTPSAWSATSTKRPTSATGSRVRPRRAPTGITPTSTTTKGGSKNDH